MSKDAITKKYSKALFENTEAAKTSEITAAELAEITKIFTSAEALAFFQSPYNSADSKLMAAKSSLEGRCSTTVFNFMATLVENERVGFLSQINESFQASVRAKGGETDGVLYVPGDVSDSFKARVEEELSRTLSKKVKLSIKKDSSLLSGYKATVGGWTVDDSAQFHLNKIKENISKRNN